MATFAFIKDNLFNRIFRKTQLEKQHNNYQKVCKDVEKADEFLKAVTRCNSLTQMVAIHKNIWGSGFRNKNIGPDECGMFRTNDILTMKPEEVFLGNIYGLWTFPIPEWDNNCNALFGANGFGINPGTRTYDLVLNQYRNLLQTNLMTIIQPEKDWLEQYRKCV